MLIKPNHQFKKITMLKHEKTLLMVLLLFISSLAYAQDSSGKLSGVVVDSQGEPIIGASVTIKGTTNGVITDYDGNFALSNFKDTDMLTISYVGYEEQEILIGTKRSLKVVLNPRDQVLDDVTVIGYGVQKKRDISSAISSVGGDVFKDKPVTNLAQGIAGKIAGVRISAYNAAPGGDQNIVIRGIGSVNASNAPLYVVDGLPMQGDFNREESPLNSINPADIESIEVLKDASSSAIYGTRAANGVILITTKKGKSGKPKINVSISGGFQSAMRKLDVLGRDDFLKYMDDARVNAYMVEDPNFGTDNPNLPLWSRNDDNQTRIDNWRKYSQHAGSMQTPGAKQERWITVSDECYDAPYDTDWQDVVFGTGSIQDIQMSVNGGSDHINYMVSFGYFNNDGIIETSGYKRYTLRSNIEAKISKWLTVGLNLAPTLENTSVLSNTVSTTIHDNILMSASTLSPFLSPYDENGDIAYLGTDTDSPWDWNLTEKVNPLHSMQIKDRRRTGRLVSGIYANVKFFDDLSWRTDFGHEYKQWERNYYLPTSVPTISARESISRGVHEQQNRNYWNAQSVLTYDKQFGDHKLTVMAGTSFERTTYRSVYLDKSNFSQDVITSLNQAGTINNQLTDARTNLSEESMIGTFARLLYNYKGRYYLTASVRRDGSSKFGADNRWAVFPSFSVAWRVSDEEFFTPFKKYVNDWKIRGGWGRIGNSGIKNYLHTASLGTQSYVFGSTGSATTAYLDSRIPNSLLGWETTSDLSIGTDVHFLNSRISLSVDYFNRKTTDMLFTMPLPAITGFANMMQNIGSMRNKGFEYMLNTHNLTGDFKWSTTATLSYYRNQVLDLGADKRPIINNNGYTTEGKPLAGIWGVVNLGPFRDWADVKSSPVFNANLPTWRQRSNPGTLKIADVNGDGILDASDYTITGTANPDFVWSITNDFSYKGFDFSFQFNGVQGGKISMNGWQNIFANGQGRENTTKDYFQNYWREDNPDAKYAAPNRKTYDGTLIEGSLMYSASYVKLENISLGYTLPRKIARILDLEHIRVYVNVNNVCIFSEYPGYNPEVNYQAASALSQGIDRGSYPLPRTTTFGINIGL